jgi:hypothetical protein
MRFITRTKIAVGATGLVLALAVQGLSPSHAQTGGTIGQFGADQTLTASATGVTTTQAFPDGATTAGCFIQVTAASGAQSTTMGSCTGITLTITCASAAFSSTQTTDQHGAAMVVGTTRTLSGAYDTGGPCAAASPPAGVTPTSAATLAGFPAGSKLVWFINNDTSASRNGCFQYFEGTTGATVQCFANTATGSNGTFYEATSTGTTGSLYQTKAASGTGASGNLTIGGVFVEAATTAAATATPAAGAGTVTPTSTLGTSAATATPGGPTPPPPPTFIPTPITPPPAPPTDTPTPAPPTATPAPTDTTVAAVPTNTPKPSAAPTNTTAAVVVAPTKPTKVHVTKPVVVPTVPPTGAGGTYVYSSNGAAKLSKAALSSAAPSSLPQTGGADGGNPTSPLAPLALLGALGVLAGRTIRKMRK